MKNGSNQPQMFNVFCKPEEEISPEVWKLRHFICNLCIDFVHVFQLMPAHLA